VFGIFVPMFVSYVLDGQDYGKTYWIKHNQDKDFTVDGKSYKVSHVLYSSHHTTCENIIHGRVLGISYCQSSILLIRLAQRTPCPPNGR